MKTVRDPELEILIVDDSLQYSSVLTKILKQVFGYRRITHVDNLESGMQELTSASSNYKIIFVDYRFPSGETGLDLISQLKDRSLTEDKLVFMITSEPTVEIVKAASSMGAVGVLAKPFDRAQLTKQLEKAERLLETESEESW